MILAGLMALSIGNGTARCQLIPSANGAQNFLGADTPLPASGFTDISIAGVPSVSNGYDISGVVYLLNGGGASTVTAQYFINNQAVGQAFNVSLAANGATTLGIPQQFNGQPSNTQVRLHITNGSGGSGVTLGAGSGLAVTGYNQNGGTATSPLQGSSTQAANSASFTAPQNFVTVANAGGAFATGLFSLNGAVTLINNNAAPQTVTGQYIIDGSTTGQPTFSMTLPGGVGTGTTLMALPTVVSLSGGTTHTIGVRISDPSGGGIIVKAGSTLSVTPYNSFGGTASAVAATPNTNFMVGQTFSPGIGGGTGVLGTVTVPTSSNTTFWDANASLMLLNTSGAAFPTSLTAQYTINGTGTGTLFNLTLPAGATTGTFYMPEQFATLTAGAALGVQILANSSSQFVLEASSLTLVAHQQVPTVAAPEPASMSLAAMAAMAFGAAAYRKRRSAKVPV